VRVSNKDTTISLESELELFRKIEINASSMASALNNSSMAHTNETKPRLRKDEVEILEREFKKNPKPTTQTRRDFAEDIGVDLARITVKRSKPCLKPNLLTGTELVPKPSSQAEAGQKAAGIRGYPSSEISGFSRACRKLT
jgi:hypothetical protein